MQKSTATEHEIKDSLVNTKIREAFELVKAVNDLNMASARGMVGRDYIDKVVALAYRHKPTWLYKRRMKRAADGLDLLLNDDKGIPQNEDAAKAATMQIIK